MDALAGACARACAEQAIYSVPSPPSRGGRRLRASPTQVPHLGQQMGPWQSFFDSRLIKAANLAVTRSHGHPTSGTDAYRTDYLSASCVQSPARRPTRTGTRTGLRFLPLVKDVLAINAALIGSVGTIGVLCRPPNSILLSCWSSAQLGAPRFPAQKGFWCVYSVQALSRRGHCRSAWQRSPPQSYNTLCSTQSRGAQGYATLA